MTSPALQQRLDKLLELHPKVIDLSLDRITALLAKLDNPEKKLPPIIHVAGTNGKGSTIAFMRSILEAADYKVHVYTSPHLVRFNERIVLAGQEADDQTVVEAIDIIEKANGDAPITFFEITTAVAFYLFSKHPADTVLLETGLGGRLDATNVIENPVACVITPISMDHQGYLGDTLEKIAAEKAGIIKPSAKLVFTMQQEAATEILYQKGNKNSLHNENVMWGWQPNPVDNGFIYITAGTSAQNYAWVFEEIGLQGKHQFQNAACAIATLHLLEEQFPKLNKEVFLKGVAQAKWPARLAASNYNNKFFILDGAHNILGAEVLANFMQHKKYTIICGMMDNKQHKEFLEIVAPNIHQLIAVPIKGHSCVDTEKLQNLAIKLGINATSAADWQAALNKADNNVPIIITGSLYLAGNVLSELS